MKEFDFYSFGLTAFITSLQPNIKHAYRFLTFNQSFVFSREIYIVFNV